MTNRKALFTALPAIALASGMIGMTSPGMAHAENPATMVGHGTMHVTKSPTCGCCSAWVALAREEGFAVETTDVGNITAVKYKAGLPGELWACHTAEIGGYVVEGHVPFPSIARLLEQRPDIEGIAVPGMPGGSPGMGDDPLARYDVIAFGGAAGEGEVFSRVGR